VLAVCHDEDIEAEIFAECPCFSDSGSWLVAHLDDGEVILASSRFVGKSDRIDSGEQQCLTQLARGLGGV
jgi:hypothetical protein